MGVDVGVALALSEDGADIMECPNRPSRADGFPVVTDTQNGGLYKLVAGGMREGVARCGGNGVITEDFCIVIVSMVTELGGVVRIGPAEVDKCSSCVLMTGYRWERCEVEVWLVKEFGGNITLDNVLNLGGFTIVGGV